MLEVQLEYINGKKTMRGRCLTISKLGVELDHQRVPWDECHEVTVMSTPPTEEEAAQIKKIEDALEEMKKWAMTDEELEELMK